MRVSPYEMQLIDAALSEGGPEIAPGTAVVLMPDLGDFLRVFDSAVSPALRDCGFDSGIAGPAFDSRGWLSDINRWIPGAEILIADVTHLNPDVMYALGLCHGLRRCPLLISQNPELLPFNLGVFRCIRYADDAGGMYKLREDSARAIRTFVAEAQASRERARASE